MGTCRGASAGARAKEMPAGTPGSDGDGKGMDLECILKVESGEGRKEEREVCVPFTSPHGDVSSLRQEW